jgi:hypothetical protein
MNFKGYVRIEYLLTSDGILRLVTDNNIANLYVVSNLKLLFIFVVVMLVRNYELI